MDSTGCFYVGLLSLFAGIYGLLQLPGNEENSLISPTLVERLELLMKCLPYKELQPRIEQMLNKGINYIIYDESVGVTHFKWLGNTKRVFIFLSTKK